MAAAQIEIANFLSKLVFSRSDSEGSSAVPFRAGGASWPAPARGLQAVGPLCGAMPGFVSSETFDENCSTPMWVVEFRLIGCNLKVSKRKDVKRTGGSAWRRKEPFATR